MDKTSKPKSNKSLTILLLIITALLAFSAWSIEQQLQESKRNGERFQKFQIEMTQVWSDMKADIKVDNANATKTYNIEIHPNTLRSLKNEKDIIKIKSDVTNIKSIIK